VCEATPQNGQSFLSVETMKAGKTIRVASNIRPSSLPTFNAIYPPVNIEFW
jgi:hypothetical protein